MMTRSGSRAGNGAGSAGLVAGITCRGWSLMGRVQGYHGGGHGRAGDGGWGLGRCQGLEGGTIGCRAGGFGSVDVVRGL
jgi:hypothetical protein